MQSSCRWACRSPRSARHLPQSTRRRWSQSVFAVQPRLDVLPEIRLKFLEIDEAQIDKILTVNVKGVIFGCQVFGEAMVAAGKGSIINLGSESGILPLSRVFTYSASKAAVHNLSKNLAREWAAKGVRVNTLVPGFFPAEQNRKVLTPERVAMILGKTPMNRFGEAKELIGASLLLASDAGSFVTGAEIVVDGGFAAMSI